MLPVTGTSAQAQNTCLVTRPAYHKVPVLSVFYSMFLHAGWLHLLFLVVFGKVPYLVLYLLCGYIAAYGFAAANQTSVEPLIGASGAISGVLGAYLVIYPRARVWSLVPFLFFIPLRIPAWLVLGMWFVLQWVYAAGFAASGAGSARNPKTSTSPPPRYPVHPRYR